MTTVFTIVRRNYVKIKNDNDAFIVGVNGFDCSGKTHFSNSLKNMFIADGTSAIVIDIDNFNNRLVENNTYESFSKNEFNKKNLETYYHQIIDFQLARKKILSLNMDYSVIIIEGIFIYKKELVDLFDFKIFLEIDYSTAKERFRVRQKGNKDSRPIEIFAAIWRPSHSRYLKEINPESLSDLVVNNSDYQQPKTISGNSRSVLETQFNPD